ncbi:hypothetical protein AB1K56_11885 [Microbacterium sp. BWR-S6Y]|uniref:hypothetical protein n=1 Tax=Microbacterium sp. BWR-S6Y TaxID=3232073 RepID=UPI003527067C
MSTGHLRELPPETRARRARIFAYVVAALFVVGAAGFVAISGGSPLFVVAAATMIVLAALMVVAVHRASPATRATALAVAALGVVVAFATSSTDSGSSLMSMIGVAPVLLIGAFLVHLLSRAVEVHGG